jgi:hypothetical protein
MFKRMVVATLAGVLVCAGGWALAQQAAPQAETGSGEAKKSKDKDRKKGERKMGTGTPGRYTVATAGSSAVLLDTATGKTWVLHRPRDGRAVWLPAQRVDSEEDAKKLLEQERARGQEKAQALERELEAARAAADDLRREAEVQREEARRALLEAQRRLQELEQKKAKDSPK